MWRRVFAQTWMALLLACGGGDASEERAPQPPSTTAPREAVAVPGAAPDVRLAWLPGGVLALENAAAAPVSLARELTMMATPEGPPATLLLGLDCAPERPVASAAGPSCITLVRGAALGLGSWPNDHGSCRCPPCVAPGANVSFVIHACGGSRALTRDLPPRDPP